VRAELSRVLELLAEEFPAVDPAHRRARTAAPSFRDRREWAGDPELPNMSHEALYRVVDRHLDADCIVVHDTCLGSYPSADLNVKGRDAFVCCPVWLSIGHSVGAAIGVGLADRRRPLVICGDGGFQITAQSLSAIARYDIPAVVIVVDNGLYAIEQYLIAPEWYEDTSREPLPYVGLNRWDYPALAKAIGLEHAVAVGTEAEFEQALTDALARRAPSFISVRIAPGDLPPENRKPGE
jgi:indolepyruvate decarboxylase